MAVIQDLCFEIIWQCLNECKFCSSSSCYSRNTIVSLEDFKRVLNYFLNQGGIAELSLSGGEPLLHPDLLEMISYSKTLGIRTILFTSGIKKRPPLSQEILAYYTYQRDQQLKEIEQHEPENERLKNNVKKYYENLINPPYFSEISKEECLYLKNIGLDKIVFDMQAYECETDQYLMGRNTQKRNCFLDSLWNATTASLEVDIHFIPMKPNFRQIGDILELLEIAKVPNFSVLNFVPQGRGHIYQEELMLSDKELLEFKELLNRAKQNFSGNIRVGIPLLQNNQHLCTAGLEKMNIKYDGTILPCPAFKEIASKTLQKYGIKVYNIYETLEEVKIQKGTRKYPLCKRIYK